MQNFYNYPRMSDQNVYFNKILGVSCEHQSLTHIVAIISLDLKKDFTKDFKEEYSLVLHNYPFICSSYV